MSALQFFSPGVEVSIYTHHGRGSIGWILAKLTGRENRWN
jgi:hypothetical protein